MWCLLWKGFWWQEGVDGVDYSDKCNFNWVSVIRLPDFVKREDFDWAVRETQRKKSWTAPPPNS